MKKKFKHQYNNPSFSVALPSNGESNPEMEGIACRLNDGIRSLSSKISEAFFSPAPKLNIERWI